MRIAYFPKQVARNGAPVLNAFLDSCRDNGIDTVENSLDADMAVIWSVLWSGRMTGNQAIYEHYRMAGRAVIIIDVGALRRGVTWKIAVNHITALGRYGHQHNLDPDRARHLGLVLAPHTGGDAVLIAAQHAHSLQVAPLPSMESWILQQIDLVKQHTDRPIVLRPHPRSQIKIPGVETETPRRLTDTYDDFDLKFNYHAVINYNSGVGIRAGMASAPLITDVTSLAHPVSIRYDQLDSPPELDRAQWLIEIAHTEYTLEEIKQAKWLTRLRKYL